MAAAAVWVATVAIHGRRVFASTVTMPHCTHKSNAAGVVVGAGSARRTSARRRSFFLTEAEQQVAPPNYYGTGPCCWFPPSRRRWWYGTVMTSTSTAATCGTRVRVQRLFSEKTPLTALQYVHLCALECVPGTCVRTVRTMVLEYLRRTYQLVPQNGNQVHGVHVYYVRTYCT
jgi:hypothetical protein